MAFHTVIYYLGYCTALFLYKDMGRVFFVPMLTNMWFNLLITFEVYKQIDFRWLIAIHGVLWLIWVLILANATRGKVKAALSAFLLLIAFFFGTLPQLLQKTDAFSAMIDLSTRIWTIWYFSAFVVVLAIFLRSTVIAYMRKNYVDVITNPRKRFLIPLGLCSGFIGVTPLLSGTIPESLIIQRFNIASHILVWGWVALELPFYIMYEASATTTSF